MNEIKNVLSSVTTGIGQIILNSFDSGKIKIQQEAVSVAVKTREDMPSEIRKRKFFIKSWKRRTLGRKFLWDRLPLIQKNRQLNREVGETMRELKQYLV